MFAFTASPRAIPDDGTFVPGWERLETSRMAPRRRRVLHLLLGFGAAALAWTLLGNLDVVVVAEGRLVPRTQLKLVQPADAGVVREVLVAEGANVIEGETLVRLDGTLTSSETRALRAEFVRRDLQRRRIDAELAGTPPLQRAGDDEEAYRAALAQFRANRQAHADALGQESAAIVRLEQDLAAARAGERKLERVVPIVRSAAERYAELRREGFASELAALEREREAIEKAEDLAAQRHVVAGLESAGAQARTRRDQVASGYRAQLLAERATADAEIARVGEALARALHRADGIEIRAPYAGTVKDVVARGAGAVVAAGTPLVTLVPAGEELVAEVLVRHEDAGFVHRGQAARVKLVTYPFQKYGTIDGQVNHVAPDATAPSAEAPAASGYRVRVSLATQTLRAGDAPFELASGMLVSAEILLGERRVVEYLLSPLKRAWGEAGRER